LPKLIAVSSPVPLPDARLSAPIDLLRVRKLFGRPQRLGDAEFLRREVATRMHERLALVRIDPQRVLDAGCGEGADLLSLQKRYPNAQVFGIDAAPAMVASARATQRAATSSLNRMITQWLPNSLQSTHGAAAWCGDFAELALPAQAVDLIWSNLALHWHPSPDRVFAEWRRVLRTDGLLMFSCFGPDTFKELRTAFNVAGMPAAMLPFVDMHDFGDMLIEAGFSTPVMDMETITVTYRSTERLFADVRALGGNPLHTRGRGLTGAQAWRRLLAQLERMRSADGTISLTFELIYGHAFRPAPKTTSRGESIVRFDLPKKQP
jgi:malonyl-CoA O-methyltransferase